MDEEGEFIGCCEEGCSAKIKNHQWGKIKAEDWFFTRDNETAYCPDHLPKWVARWREKKKEKDEGR